MSTRLFPKHTVSTTQPVGGQAGDEWFNPTTNRLYKMLVVNGISSDWKELSQPSLTAITANAFTSLQTFDSGLTTSAIVLKSTSKASSVDYKRTSSSTLKSTQAGDGPTMAFSFTVDNDENPCLVVTIAMNDNTTNVTSIVPTWTVGSITQTFIKLGEAALTRTSIWYLAAPTVGSGFVYIALSAAGSYWEAGVSLFTGVNQSTPMDKFTTVLKPSLNGTSLGQSYIASHPYSGLVNELIIAVISNYSNLTNPNSASITTAYSTQTKLWELSSDGGHRGMAFFQPSSSSASVSALYPDIITNTDVTWVIGSLKPATSISDGSGTLQLNGTSSGNTYTQLRSSAQPSANMTYTFPASAPSAGQILSSDSSGNLSWVANSAGASLSVANTWTARQVIYSGTSTAPPTSSIPANNSLSLGGDTNPHNAGSGYGLYIGTYGSTGDTWINAQRADGSATYNILLNTAGGNVGIGNSNPKSTLHAGGSQSVKVSLSVASTTLDATRYIITTPATGDIIYTLPDASVAANRVYIIKRLTPGTVTITPATNQYIETGAVNVSFLIPAQYDSYTFVSDGTSKWYIV